MITCGTQIVSGAPVNGGGGASLPDDPAAVLLDAANAGKAVGLAPGTGEGSAVAFGDLVGDGIGEATALAANGDFLVGDGAGGSQLASAAASAVRTVIGVSISPTTTRGDLIVRGASADQRLAIGASGRVLTSDGTDPVWSTPSGPTISSGTYASRPASPAVGDIYTVTSGARRGSVYRATAASTWELWRVLSPVSATVMLDAERFDGSATGGWVLTWPGELGASAVAISQSATMAVLTSAAGGLPGVRFSSPVGMRVPWIGESGATARWLAAIVSRVTTDGSGYNHIAGWGAGSSGQLFALTTRTNSSNVVGAHWWGSSLSSAVAPVSGTTPSVYLLQYDGSTATLYQDGTSIASGAVALNTGTGLPLTLGVNPSAGGEVASCTLHAVLAGSGTLDSTARTALRTWSQDRFGSP